MDTPRIECMIDRGNNLARLATAPLLLLLATPLRSIGGDGGGGDIVCRGQRGPRDTRRVKEGSRKGLKGRKEQKVFAFLHYDVRGKWSTRARMGEKE